MSSLKPEMINKAMLKATVDKYQTEIREIGNTDNAPLLYIRMVLQTFVDHDKTEIEGLKKGVISDDFLSFSPDVGEENLWLYLRPYEVVKASIDSLGLLDESESNPLCDDGRDQRTRSSLINLSLLTSEMVEKRIAELLEEEVVSEADVNTMASPSADLVDVDDEIKQILPGGEYFRDFIVLLSELNERSGCGIELPSVSDFVNLGRRFIELVEENSELQEKCSLTADGVEKISLENELKEIKEQLKTAWIYATDGVYSSDDGVKVVKTIDSSNLNGIASGIAMEKVGVYNSDEFGLVSKKNEEKAKLLDKGTHDIYKKETEGVYDKTTQIVLTKEEVEQKEETRKQEDLRRIDLVSYDSCIRERMRNCTLVKMCERHVCNNADKKFKKAAEAELNNVFPYIKAIASLFVDVDYLALSLWDIIVQKIVKEELCTVSYWQEISVEDTICGKDTKRQINCKLLEELQNARSAARRAAVALKENMVQCKIGGATDKDLLMLQLLAAAISGYDVEDIKKTF